MEKTRLRVFVVKVGLVFIFIKNILINPDGRRRIEKRAKTKPCPSFGVNETSYRLTNHWAPEEANFWKEEARFLESKNNY
jgi:hypothetical protein